MRRPAVLLLPLTVILACAPAATTGTPQPTMRWAAALEPAAAFAEVSARVTAVRSVGATTIQIEVNDASPGSVHPWHVHDGTCETGGGIVGEANRYPPLQIGDQGRALATALIELELAPGQPYHVNVHASPEDLATIVACGDLREAD